MLYAYILFINYGIEINDWEGQEDVVGIKRRLLVKWENKSVRIFEREGMRVRKSVFTWMKANGQEEGEVLLV